MSRAYDKALADANKFMTELVHGWNIGTTILFKDLANVVAKQNIVLSSFGIRELVSDLEHAGVLVRVTRQKLMKPLNIIQASAPALPPTYQRLSELEADMKQLKIQVAAISNRLL